MRWQWLFWPALAAAAGLWLLLRPQTVEPPDALPPPPVAAPETAFPPPPVSRSPATQPASAATPALSPETEIFRLGRRLPVYGGRSRQAFAESEDLAAFALDRLPEALRGDGASQYLIYLALEQCTHYLRLDAGTVDDFREQMLATFGELTPEEHGYWQREHDRCRGFALQDWSALGEALGDEKTGVETGYGSVWFERAVRAGHPPAVAEWALRPGPFGVDERRGMLRDAIASGDAEVLWLVAVHGGDIHEGQSNVSSLAWLLTACRRGYDCGPYARWYRVYACMPEGRSCISGQSAIEHYWHALAPHEREQAYELAGDIGQWLAGGDWDALPLPPLITIEPRKPAGTARTE
jgi:hypothetical protein